jgi:hypothetical protein
MGILEDEEVNARGGNDVRGRVGEDQMGRRRKRKMELR